MERPSSSNDARTAHLRFLSRLGVALLALTLVSFGGPTPDGEARGRKPAEVFKGKIILSSRPFPPRFKNDAQFVSYMKKVGETEFWPEKEGGSWYIDYMAFFAKPLERRPYSVLFFDISERNNPLFITEGSSHPQKPGLRIMAGNHELQPPHFQENKKYLVLFSPSAEEPALAEAEFVLRPFDADKAAEARARRDKAAAEALRAKEEEEEKKKKATPSWEPPNW